MSSPSAPQRGEGPRSQRRARAATPDSGHGEHQDGEHGHSHSHPKGAALVISALGIVFGDIGTSPLYALKECINGVHGVAANNANLLGVLSLIVWSLTLVVTVKYLT